MAGFVLRITPGQFSVERELVGRPGLEPGTTGLKVRNLTH